MNHWVLYMSGGAIGSMSCHFPHFPPTAADLLNMQELIKGKYGFAECAILNWKELTEEPKNE